MNDLLFGCCNSGVNSSSSLSDSIVDRLSSSKAARKRYDEKIGKYGEIITQYNNENPNVVLDTFTVVPFVLETSGYFHEKALDFLDRVAEHCQEVKKYQKENVKSYFLNVLSICYQTQVARSIIRRIGGISSHVDGPYTHHFEQPMLDYIIHEEDAPYLA